MDGLRLLRLLLPAVLVGPGEVIPFPVTVGHYSFMSVPAVAFQLQVAP